MSVKQPPTTRYQGSKRKLLSWIDECIADRTANSVMDLMSGSASVAYHFKAKGCRVAANDYLRCNFLTGLALIENSSETLSSTDIDFLLEEPPGGQNFTFIRDNFSGYFFTDDENGWIDHRLANIERLSTRYDGDILKYKRALSFHILAQATLMKRPFNLFHRKNLYLRLSDVKRSFGNKTTWEHPFPTLFRRLADEVNGAVFSNGMRNTAHNELAEQIDVPDTFDLVYVDAPYFSADRDSAFSDYRFLYHFLEGMARYDEWSTLIDLSDVRHALRRNYNELNPLKMPRSRRGPALMDWFRVVLAPWKESTLVLSYKSPGVPTRDELIQVVGEFKTQVTVFEKPYKYALSRRNGLPDENIELLIIGE